MEENKGGGEGERKKEQGETTSLFEAGVAGALEGQGPRR